MLAWNPYATMGLLTILVGWGAGIFVYKTAPQRLANRTLAVLLIAESTAVGLARGVRYLLEDPTVWLHGLSGVGAMLMVVNIAAYLLFLSTVDSPLTRPLRITTVRIGVVVLAVAWCAYAILGPIPAWPTLYLLNFEAWVWVGVYGLLVAGTTWWLAPPGSGRRRQARAYALAFGWRDLVWFGYRHIGIPIWVRGESGGVFESEGLAFALFAPSITIVFVLLLAYGMLRTQLFDIDIKLKWTLKRSTLVAAFVALFFVVSESAALFFGDRIGPYLGILAAGALLFAIAPLQRIADRIADAAMPKVHDTAEYRTVRKHEVYQAAVESLLEDGEITEKDRRTLATLQDQLGLMARDAHRVESLVRNGSKGAAGLVPD